MANKCGTAGCEECYGSSSAPCQARQAQRPSEALRRCYCAAPKFACTKCLAVQCDVGCIQCETKGEPLFCIDCCTKEAWAGALATFERCAKMCEERGAIQLAQALREERLKYTHTVEPVQKENDNG